MARLKDLERDEERLEQEVANLPERTVVRLPTNYTTTYRTAIAGLQQLLATPETSRSRNVIRALIETAVVHGGDSEVARYAASTRRTICIGCWSSRRLHQQGRAARAVNDNAPGRFLLGALSYAVGRGSRRTCHAVPQRNSRKC